ncbi:hypothetical protein V1506DRAFT_581263 [Lipomyces tetrasporus]
MAEYGTQAAVLETTVNSIDGSDSASEKKGAYVTAESDVDGKDEIIYSVAEKEMMYAFIGTVENLRDILDEESDYILDKMRSLTLAESLTILEEAAEYYKEDVIFPDTMMQRIKILVQGEQNSGLEPYYYQLETRLQAALLKFHSPYPEVRAVVRPTDDPWTPCETFGAYAVGIFWPSITLNATVLQVLIYPSGKFIAKALPQWTINVFGRKLALNPGPWTFKEQMFVTIMTNVVGGSTNFFHYGLVMRLGTFFDNQWEDTRAAVVETTVNSIDGSDSASEKKDAHITTESDVDGKDEVIYSVAEKENMYAFICTVENLRDILDEEPDYILPLEACLIKYHSPYPEVRAVCKPVDDTSIAVATIRSYLIGTFWVVCASFINQFFDLRQPRLFLNTTVIQILIYPTGKLLQLVLPRSTIKLLGRSSA